MPFDLQEFFEGASVAELVDKVEIVVGLEHLDVLDDVRRGLDAGEGVDLVDGAFLQLRVVLEALHRHHLHCVLLLVLYVHRLVHLTVDALADGFVQGVVVDYSGHSKYNYYTRLPPTA